MRFCGVADCHVASLLAMTCRNLLRVSVCKDAHPVANPQLPAGLLGSTALYPQARICLLHVIANYVLATAATLPSTACHCEPVRTPVAIRIPAEKAKKWAVFWANSYHLPFRLKYCYNVMRFCGVTDCHVASLLAITCRNLLRVCVCKYLFQQHPGIPLAPGHISPLFAYCYGAVSLTWRDGPVGLCLFFGTCLRGAHQPLHPE